LHFCEFLLFFLFYTQRDQTQPVRVRGWFLLKTETRSFCARKKNEKTEKESSKAARGNPTRAFARTPAALRVHT
jgi:hypothetical protein